MQCTSFEASHAAKWKAIYVKSQANSSNNDVQLNS